MRLVNSTDTPLEVLGGGLYLLFDPRVSSKGGNCCPNFAFEFGMGDVVKLTGSFVRLEAEPDTEER